MAELQRSLVEVATQVTHTKGVAENLKVEFDDFKELSEVPALTAKIQQIQKELATLRSYQEHNHTIKVDTKQMRPKDYIGDKSDVHFTEWAFKFIMYISANYKNVGTILEWAMKEKQPITEETMLHKAQELRIHDVEEFNHYVYTSIASCLGGEAMTFLLTLTRGEQSVEVWRQLNQRYDPDTARAQTMGMKGLLNRPRAKSTKDLVVAIEKWESEIRSYEVRTRDVLQDSVKQETLNGMLSSDIEQKVRMEQAMGCAKNYASMREAVMTYIRSVSTNASALDVGRVEKEDRDECDGDNNEYDEYETNYAGYDKGYGKGNHMGYSKGYGKNSSAMFEHGQGKGKGKDNYYGKGWQSKAFQKGQFFKGEQKGKGKPKGSGKDNWACHNCGQKGHIAAWCPMHRQNWGSQHKGGKGMKGWPSSGWSSMPIYSWETEYDVDHDQSREEMDYDCGDDVCAFSLTAEKIDDGIINDDTIMKGSKVKISNRYDAIAGGPEDEDEDAEDSCHSMPHEFPLPAIKKNSKMKKMPKVTRKQWTVVETNSVRNKAVSILTKESDREERIDKLGHSINGGSVQIKGTVDSGAAEHVANRDHFPQFEVLPAKKGVRYVTANGERIPHAGEQRVKMMTNEGNKRAIDFQLSEVDKPLLGANKICKNGHYIILDEKEGWIVNKRTSECTKLEVEDGTYKMNMWIQDFQRQASQ